MKSAHYRFGKYNCHAYMKSVGHGWEVGFHFGKQTVFVGNFIHQKEATKWWSCMNKELKTFTKRYGIGAKASFTWYTKFCSNHLYKTYYGFLDQEFTKYQRSFEKAHAKDVKAYNSHKAKWHGVEHFTLRKSA